MRLAPVVHDLSKKRNNKFVFGLTFVSLLFIKVVNGQDAAKDSVLARNTFTTEIFGHGQGIISLNYERIFVASPRFLFTLRSGVGFTPGVTVKNVKQKGVLSIPIVCSFLYGKKESYFQLSAGYTADFGPAFIDSAFNPPDIHQKYQANYIISAGYRYMWNGFVGQAYPLIQWTNNPSNRFFIGGGVSLGVTF